MSRRLFAALPGVVLAVHLLTGAVRAAPFVYPEGRHGKGELRQINGLPVLVVEGSPEEIGDAVAVLGLRPARRIASYPDDMLEHFHGTWLRDSFLAGGRKMVERFPADYRREFEAMARAAGVERDKLVLGNTLFDLKKCLACSALLVEPSRSALGGPLLGRNLDYPPLGYAHEYALVTVYRPTGKHAFAAVGFPGLVGCLSGMNDAGLSLAILEAIQTRITTPRLDHEGVPYALCYRELLEKCSTVVEARQALEKMHRSTVTNLVVADRANVAVFEVTPKEIHVRVAAGGTCVCTNHFCTDGLRPLVRFNWYHTLDRYHILEETAAARTLLGVEDVHRGLDEARNDKETLQTMIFEPATLRLHLAIGACPASAQKLQLLELEPLFRGVEEPVLK
jgi:isopenicillin-N N-acyltransferase-like protein